MVAAEAPGRLKNGLSSKLLHLVGVVALTAGAYNTVLEFQRLCNSFCFVSLLTQWLQTSGLMAKPLPTVHEVFTDGACSHNGGLRGRPWAGLGVHWPLAPHRDVAAPVSGPKHSNNVAELQAIEAALDRILLPGTAAEDGPEARYIICSDSMYALKAISVWWKKWTTSGFPPTIQNKALITNIVDKLDRARGADPARVALKHVYGHADSAGNIEADRLARQGAAAAAAAAGSVVADDADDVDAAEPAAETAKMAKTAKMPKTAKRLRKPKQPAAHAPRKRMRATPHE